MTISAPQRKIGDYINVINDMLNKAPDEDLIAELERDAIKLKEQGIYNDGTLLLGLVASLRMDVVKMDEMFKALLVRSGRDPMYLRQYAAALLNAYQYCRAAPLIDEAAEYDQGDIDTIKSAISIHTDGLDINRATAYLDKLEKLNVEYVKPEKFKLMEMAQSSFQKLGVDSNKVAERIGLAATAVNRASNKRPHAKVDMYDGVLLFGFVLYGTNEEAIKAEDEMIREIANEQPSPVDNAIYFSCTAA